MHFHQSFKSGFVLPTNTPSKMACFVFKDKQLIHTEENFPTVPYSIYQGLLPYLRETVFLGEFNNLPYLVSEFTGEITVEASLVGTHLKDAYLKLSPEHARLANHALQLLHWEKTHKFCSRCAHTLQSAKTERAKVCPQCDYHAYPRISPAILVAIRKENEILLSHAANFPPNLYSLLAGFVEPGESLEETVHREVFEEVGLYIKNVRYISSHAWPFPDSLMLGFIADYESGEINVDGKEIIEAAWFSKKTLPKVLPHQASLSWALIQHILQN